MREKKTTPSFEGADLQKVKRKSGPFLFSLSFLVDPFRYGSPRANIWSTCLITELNVLMGPLVHGLNVDTIVLCRELIRRSSPNEPCVDGYPGKGCGVTDMWQLNSSLEGEKRVGPGGGREHEDELKVHAEHTSTRLPTRTGQMILTGSWVPAFEPEPACAQVKASVREGALVQPPATARVLCIVEEHNPVWKMMSSSDLLVRTLGRGIPWHPVVPVGTPHQGLQWSSRSR